MDTILVVDAGYVTISTEDIGYTGPLVPILSALLLDDETTQSYITGVDLYGCLAEINKDLQGKIPGWKMRISKKDKFKRVGNYIRGRFFVDYIAIDRKVATGKRIPRTRIDIINLDLIYDKPPKIPSFQLEATLALFHIQRKRGLKRIRSSRGAIGAALLKASPLWENQRHAAPRVANQISREFLPGNFHSISSRVSTKDLPSLDHCYYVDQQNAHHSIALSSFIPHPHNIRARGNYKSVIEKKKWHRIWCRPNDPLGECIVNQHQSGLVLAKIHISTLPPTKAHLYPPWATKRGTQYVWIWTPEFRLITNDSRFQLDSFVAGFTGYVRDPVLPEYAKWSLDYLGQNLRGKQYTKTALLAAYGMLAFNSENFKELYRFWGGSVSGTKVTLPQAGVVSEKIIKFRDDHPQHRLTNVIARGIIEAETRTRSLEYAKELDNQGFHVAQIYVDGILVETDQLPFIPPGWNLSHSLTHVSIPRSNALISDQLVKLPGIHRTESDARWLQKREEARGPIIHLTPA